jgi:tubulin-folding cofactor B
MFLDQDSLVKINASHSHTKTVLAEIRFYKSQKLFEVKSVVGKKFGTLPEYMKLKLIRVNGEEQPLTNFDEERTLKELKVEDFDTIHVIDLNPNSTLVQMNFDDLSTVKKYEISEDDYMKRNDNARKFRQKIMNDPNYKAMIEANQGPTYEEQASQIEVGQRCLLGDGFRRGEIKFVGIVKELGYGFWVGVRLDEPMGDTNGKIKGKEYFTCEEKYGVFVRPDYVKTGDYPPEDLFNADEDEI